MCSSYVSWFQWLADMWSGISNIFDVFGVNWNFLESGLAHSTTLEKIVARQ